MKRLRLDFYVTILILLLATALTLACKINFLFSTLLFFGAPSVYLLARKIRSLKEIFLASVFFGLILMFEMDFLAELNHVWIISDPVFVNKFLGVVTLDIIVWSFLWVFFVILFYQHFFEHEKKEKVSPHFKYGLLPALSVLAVMLLVYFVDSKILTFPYSYLILGLASFAPFVFPVVRKKVFTQDFVIRFLKMSLFFFFVHLIQEVTMVKLGYWIYPAQGVGYLELMGGIRFPIEEFVFWIVLSTSVLLADYEFFIEEDENESLVEMVKIG